jgi:hypothetical protein
MVLPPLTPQKQPSDLKKFFVSTIVMVVCVGTMAYGCARLMNRMRHIEKPVPVTICTDTCPCQKEPNCYCCRYLNIKAIEKD